MSSMLRVITQSVLSWHPVLSLENIRRGILIFAFFSLITGLALYKVIFIANGWAATSFWTFYGILVSLFLISRIPAAYLYEDDHVAARLDSEYPDVSIIIAAKNEERGIFETIMTCVRSRYAGKIQIIAIDDGSTDGTRKEMMRARALFGEQVVVRVFDTNRGKKEAMALGVMESTNEIIVFVDSDSFIAPDAIRHITEHFLLNAKIGAVSGNTKVHNAHKNLLTRMQSIQYAISFDIYKASESLFNSVTCCPGCFSAYRRDAILPLLQNWRNQSFLGVKGTFGDDRSLTNFVLKTHWNVVYCEKAKAATTVPEKFSVYWRQQLRWKKSWIREGTFASLFMWKRNFFGSVSFYINFSFPFLGPLLAIQVFIASVLAGRPLFFLIFVCSFMLLGLMFSLFVCIYRGAKYWICMPLFSLYFVSALLIQMPYAMATLRDTRWGTR